MRLATALLFFVQIALCGGAPAARMRTRAAAAVAAPVAAPLAPPAAAANIDGNEDIDDDDNGDDDGNGDDDDVLRLPDDEVLNPSEMARRYNDELTKDTYRRVISSFCLWLYDDDDELLLSESTRNEFAQISGQHDDSSKKGKKAREDAIRARVRQWLIEDEKVDPGSEAQHDLLNFELFKPQKITDYMCSRRLIVRNKETGRREERNLGKSRYSTIRTALSTYLTTMYDKDWTAKELTKIRNSLKGIVNETAKNVQKKGGGKQQPGKKEMSFELLEKTHEWLIEDGTRSAVFTRAYLAKTWSLNCRSDSTQSVKTADIMWSGDASGIVFAHAKNDQDGSRARKPRHGYFNPIQWWICPELALFEYLVVFPEIAADTSRGAKLFRGGKDDKSASDRFWKYLKKIYMEHEDEVKEMGYHISDLGTHSIRKGATTYLTSGTTDGPNSIAACNRGGWNMGRVLNIYCLYERAGDQYCGRILSGLPTLSPQFAVLPPEFVTLRRPTA